MRGVFVFCVLCKARLLRQILIIVGINRGGLADDQWRKVFDKVFSQLHADHPADEWTLRIVDQPHGKPKLEAENPQSNAEFLAAEVTEEIVKSETTQAQEAAPENAQQAESIEAPTEQSYAVESSDSTAPLVEVSDVIGLSNAENLAQTEQSVQEETLSKEPLASQPTEEPVITEEHTKPHEGQVETAEPGCQSEHAEVCLHDARGEDVAQTVVEGHMNGLPLAVVLDQTNEGIVEASNDQQFGEQEVKATSDEETLLAHISEELKQLEVALSEPIQTEPLQVAPLEEKTKQPDDFPVEQTNEEAAKPDVGYVQAVLLQTPPDDLGLLANQSGEQPAVNEVLVAEEPVTTDENGSPAQVVQDNTLEESHESETIRMYAETRMFLSTAPDLPRTDMDIEPPTVEVTLNNQEDYKPEALMNGDAYDEPEKQIDELEVKPAQVEQESAQPEKTERASQTPQRPSSPPAKKEQPEEHSRKPEWMRRPLVRKGSVGRFLGRMKETMQSKRFHQDRLPVVVPPPLPDPPKRPPRRKTLHNLDLTRESLGNTSAEQSQVEAAPAVLSTPPQQQVVPNETDNRSGTLRSTASERRRKNSVGRFLGKVLSASSKHANQPESGTAAEEAPLLQDPPNEPAQQQTAIPPVADTPARSVSPTPAPSEKSRKLPHASLTDVSQYFRRILRPKTPTPDEAKSEKHAPERPPPPHPQSNDTSVEEEKQSDEKNAFVKQAKVHFKCQVRRILNVVLDQMNDCFSELSAPMALGKRTSALRDCRQSSGRWHSSRRGDRPSLRTTMQSLPCHCGTE